MRRLLVGLIGVAALASSVVAAEPIRVDVAFSGLWWSEAETIGMDMTSPPPKTTRVTIKDWDAGDNLWPPHPDVVDVDVTVTADVAVKQPIEVSYQYEVKGRLTAPKPIIHGVIDLAPGASQVLRGSINVMSYISDTRRPKFVKVTAKIGKGRAVTAQLPFVLGD